MDKLRENPWTLLEREPFSKLSKFESDLWKTNEDVASQVAKSLTDVCLIGDTN